MTNLQRNANSTGGFFVAMSRAMHELLVLVPADLQADLFVGFDPALWKTQRESQALR